MRTLPAQFPTPMYGRRVGSDLTVIVNATGRIDEEFTRYWSVSGEDEEFHQQFIDALRGARFDPGRQGLKTTRYGFRLILETNIRTDTIAQKLVWRYVEGVVEDSLIGEWYRVESEPPHTPAEVNSVAQQVTKTLRQMQVLLPTLQYCIIADNPTVRDAAAQELYANVDRRGPLFGGIPRSPCEADVSQRRYRVEKPIRTGGGRTVVQASGDLLRNWPPGLDGRLWLTWNAYCVVPQAGPLVNRARCYVTPTFTGDANIDGWAPPMFSDTSSNAPLQIAVEVTTRGSFWTDTIKAPVFELPAFEDRAAFLRDVSLCRDTESWTMLADSITGKERIAWLKISGNPVIGASMRVDVVQKRPSTFYFDGCPGSRSNVTVAAFLLGTLGDPPLGAVDFCYNVHGCQQRIVIDPVKHTLATQPVLSFKFSELRAEAMLGEQYHLRLHTNRDVEGLIPFLVLRHGANASAFVLVRHSSRRYDFGVIHTPPISKATVVDIYLATLRWPKMIEGR